MRSACCARAASGHTAADPAITLMKSRRRIAFPEAQDHASHVITAGFTTGEMGSGVSLHASNPEPPMSALGQKQTLQSVRPMSALPPKADINERPLAGAKQREGKLRWLSCFSKLLP